MLATIKIVDDLDDEQARKLLFVLLTSYARTRGGWNGSSRTGRPHRCSEKGRR